MDDSWSRAEPILDRLLDGEVAASAQAVREALAGEPDAVRREVESLLPHLSPERALPGDLASSLPGLLAELAADAEAGPGSPRSFGPGEVLGAYRLVEEIGRGGMGVVFLAERADRQFEKRVALKVLAAPGFGEQARQRFLRERQILAELEHPAIARLLDGGVADDGSPYLVMELVEGEPIDRHCARTGASVERRLELFLEVCDAVSAAHQRLIVHRDIKPPNVLVDAEGHVKLLDFGIAGLLEETGETPAATVLHAFTPEYASPEQVRLERAGTASDVYSLGLLLYLLLTGRLPYRTGGLRPSEIERVICETEAPAPSTAIDDPPGGDPRERSRRARRVRGDLDHVVLKALDKDTSRRYPSAGALAADLRRHLRGLPVEARPATAGYRARRFVGRHRVPVAAACAIALSLVVGLALAASQAASASRERNLARAEAAKAGAVAGFLTELFEEASPFEGEEPTAGDLLRRGEARISEELAGHPAARAELLRAMGRAYSGLGDFDAARRLTAEAVEIERARGPGGELGLAAALLEHGLTWNAAGERERGSPFVRQALAVLVSIGAEVSELGARAHRSLGAAAADPDLEVAARHLERALEIQRQIAPGESVALGLLLHDLALVRARQGREREELALKLEALAMIEPRVEPGAPVVHQIQSNLALTLAGMGRYGEAAELQRSAIAGLEARLGSEHPGLVPPLTSFGRLLLDAGRHLEAATPIERAAAIAEARGLKGYSAIGAQVNLATLRREQGDLDEAVALYRASLDALADLGLPPESGGVARVESLLGQTLARQRRSAAAGELLARALAAQRSDPGTRSAHLAETAATLGETWCQTERPGEGLALLEEGCRGLGEGFGPSSWQAGACALRVASCHAAAGATEAALTALATAQGLLPGELPPASYWPQRLATLSAALLSLSETEAEPAVEMARR